MCQGQLGYSSPLPPLMSQVAHAPKPPAATLSGLNYRSMAVRLVDARLVGRSLHLRDESCHDFIFCVEDIIKEMGRLGDLLCFIWKKPWVIFHLSVVQGFALWWWCPYYEINRSHIMGQPASAPTCPAGSPPQQDSSTALLVRDGWVSMCSWKDV